MPRLITSLRHPPCLPRLLISRHGRRCMAHLLPMATPWSPSSPAVLHLLGSITRQILICPNHRIRRSARSPFMLPRRALPNPLSTMVAYIVLLNHRPRLPPSSYRRPPSSYRLPPSIPLSPVFLRRLIMRPRLCALRLITRLRLRWISRIVLVAHALPRSLRAASPHKHSPILPRPLFPLLLHLALLRSPQIPLRFLVLSKLTCVVWRTRSSCA
jgi:hypothetical protein